MSLNKLIKNRISFVACYFLVYFIKHYFKKGQCDFILNFTYKCHLK